MLHLHTILQLTMKILIFSLLWSGLCEESHLCFVLFFFPPSSPRQRKSNWLIQVRTIAPQIWEKLVLVCFSDPGDRRRVGKQRWLCFGQTVTQWNPFGTFFQVSTPVQLKKNRKTKQEQCVLYFPHSSSERWGCGLALGLWDCWLVV